jgi:quercetin dioxygenase-like cupin family protein
MQLLNVSEKAKERKKGQRRIDLFRRENLETWILIFPPGDVQVMHNHPSDRTYYVLTGKGIMKGLNETTNFPRAKSSASPPTNSTKGRIPSTSR